MSSVGAFGHLVRIVIQLLWGISDRGTNYKNHNMQLYYIEDGMIDRFASIFSVVLLLLSFCPVSSSASDIQIICVEESHCLFCFAHRY